MNKENKPYNFKVNYVIEDYYKHPTLIATERVEVIHVPEYAINHVLNFFIKIGVLAVRLEDYDTFTKYCIYPRYIIQGDLNE